MGIRKDRAPLNKIVDHQTTGKSSLLRTLIDHLPDYIFIKDTRSRFIINNPAHLHILGATGPDEVIGKTDFDIFPYELAAQYYADEQELIRTGQPLINREEIAIDPQGRKQWLLTTKVPLRDDQGRIVGLVGISRDITQRQQLEEALRESEAFSRAVLSSLAAHIAVLNREGTIIAINEAWQRFNRENGDPDQTQIGVGINYLDACRRVVGESADEAQRALVGIQAVLDGSQSHFSLEYPCHSPTEKRWFLMQVTPLPQKHGGVVISHVDISKRKQAEDEKIRLFEAVSQQRQQLRALTRQLAELQEAERKQLARELHDRVGQNLTALGLNLNIIRGQIAETPPATHLIQARLDDSLALIEQTTECIRHVMADLRPPVLDDYGLVAALHWYGTQFASRIDCAIAVQGEELTPRLAPPVENALFRIAQEALTNAAKHAQATEIRVTVTTAGNTVRLVIADNGCGFEPAHLTKTTGQQGWGLITMAERAETVGGHCQIESHSGQGTRIIIEVRQ